VGDIACNSNQVVSVTLIVVLKAGLQFNQEVLWENVLIKRESTANRFTQNQFMCALDSVLLSFEDDLGWRINVNDVSPSAICFNRIHILVDVFSDCTQTVTVKAIRGKFVGFNNQIQVVSGVVMISNLYHSVFKFRSFLNLLDSISCQIH